MADFEDYEEIDSPVLEFETVQLGRIALNWLNTRTFLFKDSRYDHVRYRDPDGQWRAFVPTTEISEMLFEYNFPCEFNPLVDKATNKWYVGYVALIFNEVDEILEEGD